MKFLMRLLPRSLVGRVYALYTVTLFAFVAAGLGLFYRNQFTVELEDAQIRADALSMAITPTVSDSAVIGDYDTIRRTLERAVYHSTFSSASFIDVKGGVVKVPREEPPDVEPPKWLEASVAERLYDINQAISVGGHDYGVLRMTFAPARIAGKLWEQTRIALALAVLSVLGGLALIRYPLVRWLGNLGRIQAFEQAMQTGEISPSMLAVDEVPLEFRKTFEVLGQAALNLQSQRAQAAVTLAAIADGVFTLDAQGRVVFANPAACAMTGRDMGAMRGRLASELLPQVLSGAGALEPWAGRRVTLKLADADDAAGVVVDTTLSPILSPEGATVGYVLACRDVSEQHGLDQRLRAELQSREAALVSLRQVLEGLTLATDRRPAEAGRDDLAAISAMISTLVARLQERGEQLNAIFALSPDGFISFDAQRRGNYVSPAFTRLTGIPDSEVLGVEEQAIEVLLRAQGSATMPWRGFEAMRRDLRSAGGEPTRRDVIELVRPVKRMLQLGLREGSSGGISQVLSLRDVTHETEVDRMKSEFLSTAAHELRTPITSIYGFSELMIDRELSPAKQKDIVSTIHRQTELMIAIVNQLLDLARIEARRGEDFELAECELCTLAAELMRDFKPPQERDSPQFDPGAGPAFVRVDRHKMAQAFGNVLSNAYKYSPGRGPVHVRIVREPDGAMVGIEVRDQGIGMTAEQLSRVSERFYRADASGNIPGTGLGMSIVKEIVELLGGRLALASEPGRGTTVTLWLPGVRVSSQAHKMELS